MSEYDAKINHEFKNSKKPDQVYGEMGTFVQRNHVLLKKKPKNVCFSVTRNTRKMQKRLFTHNYHPQRFVTSFYNKAQ